jgi:hypothetical protein
MTNATFMSFFKYTLYISFILSIYDIPIFFNTPFSMSHSWHGTLFFLTHTKKSLKPKIFLEKKNHGNVHTLKCFFFHSFFFFNI